MDVYMYKQFNFGTFCYEFQQKIWNSRIFLSLMLNHSKQSEQCCNILHKLSPIINYHDTEFFGEKPSL